MLFKAINNPVGTVFNNEFIEKFIQSMKLLWDKNKKKTEWWKPWEKVNLVPVTHFLINCLDDLIAYVDQIPTISGADKKATVLFAIGQIYDYIAKETFPIWLIPFSGSVRAYIIYVLISLAIDWIVQKYRDGYWKSPNKETIEAKWIKLHVQLCGIPLGLCK